MIIVEIFWIAFTLQLNDHLLSELFAFQVYESSQEQLDEEYEAEKDGFAETGCLEENPASKEFRDEGTEEESTEEEAEENEDEEGLETAEASEDKVSANVPKYQLIKLKLIF